MVDKNIDFYNTHAAHLFEQYQLLSFKEVHHNWLPLLSNVPVKQALDIGAGSGRDTMALNELGFNVTAVEPAQTLRKLGEIHCEGMVEWVNDSLPLLSELKDKTFELVLVSAVWMHLNESQQHVSLSRINSLLSDNGLVVITLRHGVFDDTRTSETVEADIALRQAHSLGLSCVFNQQENDKLNRSSITWQTLVFAKQGAIK
jgi:2-polyprenyl-3-methyl-5-hydroxy-6-metoxy-1,4-benzoquinol methylase